MNESAAFAVRRKLASGGIFKTFYDRLQVSEAFLPLAMHYTYSLARSVESDDQCQRRVELDYLTAHVVE